MPTYKWSEIPERHRTAILEQEAEGRARGVALKQFIVPPENFDPVYEARELVADDFGYWEVDYADQASYLNYEKYTNAPQPIRFGLGWGYRQVPEEFRPKEPVEINFLGPNPEFGCRNKSGLMALHKVDNALLVSDEAYQLIQQTEPIPDDRRMAFTVIDKTNGERRLPYHLIDPARLNEEDVDYPASHMKWFRPKGWTQESPDDQVWNSIPIQFGTVYQPGTAFHLRREPGPTSYIFISKDLLFTLYDEGVELAEDRFDPHADLYGHHYVPRNLLK
jgi:hypothetical protein